MQDKLTQGAKMEATFIVYFFFILHPTSAFFFQTKYEIYPADAFLFVGDKLKFWIKSKSDLVLTISKLSLEAASGQRNVEKLTAVNNTHGYIEIEATEELGGRNTISCIEFRLCMSALVTIESRIESVKDIQIVLNYAEMALRITWTLGQNYFDHNNLNITAVWNVNTKPTDRSQSCLENITSCLIHYGFQSVIELLVSVELIQTRQDNYMNFAAVKKNANFMITPHKHVKPVTPEGVTIKDVTSHSFIVSWSTSSGIKNFAFNLSYQIQVSNSENSPHIMMKEEVLVYGRYNNNTISSQINGLEPATEYNVDVRVKPAESGYWSDRSYITITTKEDRPDRSPLLKPTSFYVEECGDGGYRRVTILWNQQPKQDINGKLTNYSIDFWKMKDFIPPYYSYASHKAPCNVTFNVTLLAYNAVGSALEPSVLTIPSESEALKIRGELNVKVKEITVFDTSGFENVSVSWTSEYPQDTKDAFMVIYHCENAPFSPGQCKGDFQTTERPFNTKWVELNIPSNIDTFGYALKTASQIAGIRWIDCIYDPTQVPLKVKKVEAMRGEVGSMVVTWEAQHCTKRDRTLVLKYHVKICAESSAHVSSKSCVVKRVDGSSKPTLYVKDLDADQRYTVIIQGESPSGKGPGSDPVSVQLMDEPTLDRELLEIIGSIIIIFFLVGIAFCIWHGKKLYQKVKGEFNDGIWEFKQTDNVFREIQDTSGGSSGDSGMGSNSIKSNESVSISQNTKENSQAVRVPDNQSDVLQMNRIEINAAAPKIPNRLPDSVSRNSSHSHSSAVLVAGIMQRTEQAESTIAPSGNCSNGYRAWDQDDKGHQNTGSPSNKIDKCSENTTASSSNDYRHLAGMGGLGPPFVSVNSVEGIMQHTEQAESTIAPSGNCSNGYRAWDQDVKGHQNTGSPSNKIDKCSENTTASSSNDYRHLVGMDESDPSFISVNSVEGIMQHTEQAESTIAPSGNCSNGYRAWDQDVKGHQNTGSLSNKIDKCSENTTASSSNDYRHLVGMDESGPFFISVNSVEGIMQHTEQAESTIAPSGNCSNGYLAWDQDVKGHQNTGSPSNKIDKCSENTTASSSDKCCLVARISGPSPSFSSGNPREGIMQEQAENTIGSSVNSSNTSLTSAQEDNWNHNTGSSSYKNDECFENATASSNEDYRHVVDMVWDPQTDGLRPPTGKEKEKNISFDDSGGDTNSYWEETMSQCLDRVKLKQPSKVSETDRNGKDASILKEVKCPSQRASLPPLQRGVSKHSELQSHGSELTSFGPAFESANETELSHFKGVDPEESMEKRMEQNKSPSSVADSLQGAILSYTNSNHHPSEGENTYNICL